ncbi:MAG: ROK family protein [Chloroflexi bacterium]|nr:ROK family protein [Chloroflexota bacterium]MCC6891405.1 ROK family protein [Anaerolineae bacterium]
MSDSLAIGVDIGGTKIAYGLVDRQGAVHAAHRLPTLPEEGTEAVINRIVQGIEHMLTLTDAPIVGIGMGSPGQINPHTGVVYLATNLDWHNVELVQGVRQRLSRDIPVWLHNDANASAMGEMLFGAAKGCSDFLILTVGTGLGGAAISGGKLLLGGKFVAMEVGHIPVIPNGRLCRCGALGCPEMYASGTGMMAGLEDHLPHYPFSVLADKENVSTEDILAAAREGDALGVLLVDEIVNGLLAVTVPIIGLLDPLRVVVGGGLGLAAWDLLGERLTNRLHEELSQTVFEDIPVVKSEVLSSAVGAASLVWYELDNR